MWLNPFYPSPQADAGYDVADYRDVDPRFGSLADADGLIADAHALGIRVIFDIVPNHTSDEHAWFRAALAAGPGSRERARYLFRDGRGTGGSEPPNDWAQHLRRSGVDAGDRGATAGPGSGTSTCSTASSPTSTGGTVRSTTEFVSILRVLVRPRRRRLPHRRRPRAGQGPGAAGSRRRFDSDGPAAGGHPHWDATRCTTCTGSGGG